MKCLACGSDNGAARKFCRACGVALAPTCQRCGSPNEIGDRFCGECGASLAVESPETQPAPPTPRTPAETQPVSDFRPDEERRPVTILFADIVGFTSLSERLDAEDVRDLTTECFRRLVAEATIFGGMVDKFIGDAVMVLFGAPSAHEDDPLRAARAALAMQSALERFNAEIEPVRGFRLALRIGIESGEVVTGLRDVNGVHEYTAIGDAVNVAARLQSATEPRTVMIGPNTARHVRRMLRLTPVEPLHLKGKSEPILAWLVEGFPENAPPTKREGSSPFVGRSEEMATFLNRLDDVRRGHGHVLAIIGDPGLGKSRLVAEAQASADDLIWWRAATSAHEESSSHAVMRSVLSQLCLPDGVIEQQADEIILERFGPWIRRSLPLIARVLGLSSAVHERDVASGTSPAEAAQLTTSAISKLLEELTVDRPSVLEIDDLHWADPSSVQLLCELLSVTERIPLLLCLVFRPERDAPIWQLRERAARYLPHRYTEIQLQPLTRKAASDLAAGLIGTHELPESLNGCWIKPPGPHSGWRAGSYLARTRDRRAGRRPACFGKCGSLGDTGLPAGAYRRTVGSTGGRARRGADSLGHRQTLRPTGSRANIERSRARRSPGAGPARRHRA